MNGSDPGTNTNRAVERPSAAPQTSPSRDAKFWSVVAIGVPVTLALGGFALLGTVVGGAALWDGLVGDHDRGVAATGILVTVWALAGLIGLLSLWHWVIRTANGKSIGAATRIGTAIGLVAVVPCAVMPGSMILAAPLVMVTLWVMIDWVVDRDGGRGSARMNAPRNPPQRDPTIALYDHACPMCRTEMLRLKRRDTHDRLRLVDIAHPEFRPQAWGFERAALERALHVRTGDGRWLIGMPAIRHVYAQVGLGWLMAPTGWPLLGRAFDRLYAWIARNRMWVSHAWGRCDGGCGLRGGH